MCLFNMFTLLPPHPPPSCCQWLGLCICHAGQTLKGVGGGGVHKKTSALLRRLCPCFLSHWRDIPSLCPSQLSRVLITDQGHPNEVPAQLDWVRLSFPTWKRRAISLKNTSLQKHTYHSGAARLSAFISHNLAMWTNKDTSDMPEWTEHMRALWATVQTLEGLLTFIGLID